MGEPGHTARRAKRGRPGFQPISAKNNCEPLRWATGFVPEGQSKSLSIPQIFALETELIPLKPRSFQSSRWDEAVFFMIPGTSYLATIVRSLRDKNHLSRFDRRLALSRRDSLIVDRHDVPG